MHDGGKIQWKQKLAAKPLPRRDHTGTQGLHIKDLRIFLPAIRIFCHQNVVLFALMLFLRLLGKTQTATTTIEIQAEILKSTKNSHKFGTHMLKLHQLLEFSDTLGSWV